MTEKQITGRIPGVFVKTDSNCDAFIADTLPIEKFDITPVFNEIIETSQAIGELKGAGTRLSNPYLLIRPMQKSEAVASSNMEGTFSDVSDLYLFEENENLHKENDTREVYNYSTALVSALKSIKQDKRDISVSFIKEIHSKLLTGITKHHRGSHITPGNFKQKQNWIGGGHDIKKARFIPSTPAKTIDLMDNLVSYISGETADTLHPIVKIALIHYQFETIHPFEDGNGRVGRILIPIYFCKENILPSPLLYLSPYFEDHKDEYIDLMYNVSIKGDWYPWISFFLKAIRVRSHETIAKIAKIESLREKYKTLLSAEKASGSLITLCEHMFESPFITTPGAQKILRLNSNRGARLNIEALIKLGILKELPQYSRPKYYVAQEILDVYRQK